MLFRSSNSKVYYTGVDLGTACVVLAVLDENYRPVAGAYRYADVVRDGMVIDYIGAIRLVRSMKEELEEKLDTELLYAAAALPPGTDDLDGGAVKNVVQAAGFEITALLDEPTAANKLLKVEDGAVVDIGGGTTGISIIRKGRVVHVEDQGQNRDREASVQEIGPIRGEGDTVQDQGPPEIALVGFAVGVELAPDDPHARSDPAEVIAVLSRYPAEVVHRHDMARGRGGTERVRMDSSVKSGNNAPGHSVAVAIGIANGDHVFANHQICRLAHVHFEQN